MKNFLVDKNSWHYKLIKIYYTYLPKDFCSYWRAFVISVFLSIILIGFVIVAAGALLSILWFPIWTIIETGSVLFGVSIYAIYAFIVAIPFSIEWFKSRKSTKKEKQPKQDGLLATKYKAWKGKYCPPVVYK